MIIMNNEFKNYGKVYSGDPEIDKRNKSQKPLKVKPRKFRPAGRPEQEIGDVDGGVMMTTSEILDFSEGEDSY